MLDTAAKLVSKSPLANSLDFTEIIVSIITVERRFAKGEVLSSSLQCV